MNIEIANRLIKLRKEKGLSQEQLADQLGLSRQAVSKWERAEASPDTDNLICLAKLYGVSLDDLLNSSQSIEDIAKDVKEQEEEKKKDDEEDCTFVYVDDDKKEGKSKVHISPAGIHVEDGEDSVHIDWKHGIHIDSKDGEHVHIGPGGIHILDKDSKEENRPLFITKTIFNSITAVGVLAVYLLLGFLTETGWAVAWPLFFLIPVVDSLFNVISHGLLSKFNIPCVVVGVYCYIGMAYGLWHPYWALFFIIPIFYAIFKPIEKLILEKRIINGSKYNFKIDKDDIKDFFEENDKEDNDEDED